MTKNYTPHPDIHKGLRALSNDIRNADITLREVADALAGVKRDLYNADQDLQELAGAMREEAVAPGEFAQAARLTKQIQRWALYAGQMQVLLCKKTGELGAEVDEVLQASKIAWEKIQEHAPAEACLDLQELINE